MNGVHDMGGMQDMGPIQYEKNEPVFHAPWEARVYGLMRTLGAQGKWNLDAFRHQIELIPPADYLQMSYYEKWLTCLSGLAVKTDLVTTAEIDSGKAAPDRPKATARVTAANAVDVAMTRPAPLAQRDVPGTPKFKVGERVHARIINPLGHTRLPRYARGKSGAIERDYGAFVFPDTNAHFLGEKPQHVYSVRFSARELWGEQAAPRDAVYLDMWDDYLEHA
jgi:nitrile hydratase